ncbi:cytochrome P450 10-like [Ptychodera flava]|uniref:cytochrome P450 10-like n=1 Tax=Ptychodera flava TaxID=63121 RepID=UPI00396A147D
MAMTSSSMRVYSFSFTKRIQTRCQSQSSLFTLSARRSTTVAQHADNGDDRLQLVNEVKVKPFDAIPGQQGKLATYINVFRNGGLARLDKYFTWRRNTLGPVWKESIGVISGVVVADPSATEAVVRAEGKYPRRLPLEPWLLYRKMGGYSLGVFLAEGEDWQRHRSVLLKPLLRPKEVASHTDTLNEVSDDLIAKIRRVHATPDKSSSTMDDELARWSMEGMAAILFNRRLGLLSDSVDPMSEEFINATKDFFRYSEALFFLPFKLQVKLNLPAWKGIRRTAKSIFDITEFHIKESIAAKKSSSDDPSIDDDGHIRHIIPYMNDSGKLTDGEILASTAELFGAAADSTSNTMVWTLDLLAWNRNVQEKLHEEITGVVKKGDKITQEHLKHLHYLKAVIRESMRLYSVLPFFTRILASDVVLCGYHVPAGTTVIVHVGLMSRDPQFFDNPDQFIPERWLRSDKPIPRLNQFAALPFATGPRQCIGRRLAELEMHLCVAKIVQNFILEPNSDSPLKPRMRLILAGDKPLNVKFVERQQKSI